MSAGYVLAHLDRPRRSGNGYSAYCRAHHDRHRSLSLTPTRERALLFCFAGCCFADLLTAHGLKATDLRGVGNGSAGRSIEERICSGRRLWQRSRPIGGTIAERYLRQARGISMLLPRSLRFLPLFEHREFGWPFPCLVAGVQGADDKFAGVSVTWLSADASGKAPVDPKRKVYGVLRGGSVRLSAAREVIAVCEGLETGLSLAQACPGLAVWCALSASNLPHVQVPPTVREIIVAADADECGESAARAATARFCAEGRRVRIVRPEPGHDFNDYLTK